MSGRGTDMVSVSHSVCQVMAFDLLIGPTYTLKVWVFKFKRPSICKLSVPVTMSPIGCHSWLSCFGRINSSEDLEDNNEDNNNDYDKMVAAGRKKSMGHKLEHPDDTFDLLDMDESGTLERGDLE